MSTTLVKNRINSRRTTSILVLSLALSLCLIVMRPASAFLNESLNINLLLRMITQIIDDNFGISRWLDILVNPCSERFPWDEKPFCGSGSGGASGIDMGEIFDDSLGDLNIPNPNSTRQRTADAISSTVGSGQPDVFEVNPTVFSVYAANQVDRLNTQASIEATLGSEGQTQIKRELNLTKKAVEDILEDTNQAQSLDVTQDVMKKQIQVLNRQSIILSAIPTNLQHLRVDNQFVKLNLNNISRTMDEIARHERVAASADAMYLLELYSATTLR